MWLESKKADTTLSLFHRFTRDNALPLQKIFSGYVQEWINTALIMVLTDFILAKLGEVEMIFQLRGDIKASNLTRWVDADPV